MNFEAIETAFELLLENVQTIENDLDRKSTRLNSSHLA